MDVSVAVRVQPVSATLYLYLKRWSVNDERVIYDGLQKVRPGVLVNIKDKDSPSQKSEINAVGS